jgi:hypothetical protein
MVWLTRLRLLSVRQSLSDLSIYLETSRMLEYLVRGCSARALPNLKLKSDEGFLKPHMIDTFRLKTKRGKGL